MKKLPRTLTVISLLALTVQCERNAPSQVIIQDEPSVDALITSVLDGGGTFTDVKFSTVIESSTGKLVLPFDPNDQADAEVLQGLRIALKNILANFNRDDSPTNSEARINEVSSYFEEALRIELNAMPELSCDYPRIENGNLQRTGYPDLRIVHEETGRVTYLDPKLVKFDSLNSSLRTFYFTPKTKTNKVRDNARHLLIGIEHDGNTGNWKFLRWHLVDLSDFKVRLKAEFQASNKDLYLPDLILESGE